MEINIFATSLETGDGVSADVVYLNKALISLGYKSTVYSKYAAKDFAYPYKNIDEYKGNKENILIIEHSLILIPFEQLLKLPDRKILRYQNITPASFFRFNPDAVDRILAGTEQVRTIKEFVEVAWPASKYSEIELVKMGYPRTRDLPIMIDLSKYDGPTLKQKTAETTFAVFGRIVKNKGQLEILKAFAEASKSSAMRLRIVGNSEQHPSYVAQIRRLIQEYGLTEKVTITGKVSEENWVSEMQNCDVLVNYSDHEGFCIPLVEAMTCGKPIIAKDKASMPYVVGKAGLLVSDLSELTAAMVQLTSNKKKYSDLATKAVEQAKEYTFSATTAKLKSLLDEVIGGYKPSLRIIANSLTPEVATAMEDLKYKFTPVLLELPEKAFTYEQKMAASLKAADVDIQFGAAVSKANPAPYRILNALEISPRRVNELKWQFDIVSDDLNFELPLNERTALVTNNESLIREVHPDVVLSQLPGYLSVEFSALWQNLVDLNVAKVIFDYDSGYEPHEFTGLLARLKQYGIKIDLILSNLAKLEGLKDKQEILDVWQSLAN